MRCYDVGLLGHGNEVSHWIPKRLGGALEGLRHGDHRSSSTPREVETLKELRTTRVGFGVWHIAAFVEVIDEFVEYSTKLSSGRLFTWGDSDKGQLGILDKKFRLVPVLHLTDKLVCPAANGMVPARIEDKIVDSFIEDFACGSYQVAVWTSKAGVFIWGKGLNGQLRHGDNNHTNNPTLVQFLKR
ncbi:hypothetical protein KIW84_030892 [Lathyrus oleraceus]|uniref:Uncharacterized protein n=1 Tax=Pisum sativum TaxID=3888 RepID=A0A9D5AUJ5_PEA|nr:hypothetical protein KIW84_030892 [Pisum sativum]